MQTHCSACRLTMTRRVLASGGLSSHRRINSFRLDTVKLHSQRKLCGKKMRMRHVVVRAEEGHNEEFGLMPSKPKTAYGEMLAYYLKMEPQLFKSAVEDQLDKIKEEKAAQKQQEEASAQNNSDKQDVVLYQRMEELRLREQAATLEDLMYVSVLEKFVLAGIDMLPRLDGLVDVSGTDLNAFTEGVHSKEAIELVREHVLSVMGPTAMAFSTSNLKLSKLQMAQVYAASVLFGYFLRRVDKRFQLERAMGVLPENLPDATSRLEKLFYEAGNVEGSEDPDSPSPSSTESDSESSSEKEKSTKKSPLRKYVESFDQETMKEMARMVSSEGAALVERQTMALFGDVKELQQEMQSVTQDVISVEELMKKVQEAVVNEQVSTLTMTVGTQRRAVLEAVAFGTFLRDVETWVDSDYGILTALPPPIIDGMGPGFEQGPGGPGFGPI